MKSCVNRKSVDEIRDKFSESISSEMAICCRARSKRFISFLVTLKISFKISTKFSLVFCFLLFLFFFYSFAANNEPSNESSLSEIKWGLHSFRQCLLHGAVNKFVLEANIINRRKCNSVQRFSTEFSTSIREKEYRSVFYFPPRRNWTNDGHRSKKPGV